MPVRVPSTRRLKVLHVSPTFYPALSWGGPIVALRNLCDALSVDDGAPIDVTVLTTDSDGPRVDQRVIVKSKPERFPAGYSVYYSRRIAGISVSAALIRQLWRLARWSDVVHLTGTYSFPTLPTLCVSRLLNKPVVWSPRGALQHWESQQRAGLKKAWNNLARVLRPRKLVLHCTSHREAQQSAIRMPGIETAIIPNGVRIPRYHRKFNREEGSSLRLLFLGLVSPKKAVDNLIRAVSLLGPGTFLLRIFGDAAPGYESHLAQLKRLVTELGLDAWVTFCGFADESQKRDAFLWADVCIAPSHSENFCNVVAEALSYGVPVIASKGVPWSDVEARGCGLWVENSSTSLAEAIRQISKSNLAEMGARGRRWMERAFDWQSIARDTAALYQRLGGDHPRLMR